MSGKDVPEIKTPPPEEENQKSEEEDKPVDPKEADKIAEKEFKSKYPSFGNRPSGLAQRKISSTGGRQYFDSGDYNKSASRKERHQMASFPHAMNPEAIHSHPTGIPPHLAHMKKRAKPAPSGLAGPVSSTKSPLSS